MKWLVLLVALLLPVSVFAGMMYGGTTTANWNYEEFKTYQQATGMMPWIENEEEFNAMQTVHKKMIAWRVKNNYVGCPRW